jgi:hypothetical protein
MRVLFVELTKKKKGYSYQHRQDKGRCQPFIERCCSLQQSHGVMVRILAAKGKTLLRLAWCINSIARWQPMAVADPLATTFSRKTVKVAGKSKFELN